MIHQGLILGLLEKEIETYGLIYVTPEGEQFYAAPYEIRLVEDRVFSNGAGSEEEDDEEMYGASTSMKTGSGGDPALLSMLKDLRKDMSRKLGLQPWIIFSDPALEDMSILYPVTLNEMHSCQGVGEGKARKYGEKFVELIKRYVEENEISRPEDFVVKSSPSKSANKIYIIQSVDRQMSLEDIADARGMDMEDLIQEIETIVSSGTKLDLNYFIRQVVDDDVVEDIYDYFKSEATSDSIDEAMNQLGPDYDELDIRLVRIKFLCEIAN